MAMTRRKQLHPKSLKEDEILFLLPDELKYDEESNDIVTRTNLKQDHRFGPFPATLQFEETFQLLDSKHNWLAYCLIFDKSLANLNINFQDNQLFVIIKESISISTRLYSNKIILPKLNMNKTISIKKEPLEIESKIHFPLVFICKTCGIRFSNQNTLYAHRQHYCIKHETTKSHSTDSNITTIQMKSMKRKSIDSSIIPAKRLSLLSSFDHPIQIGQLIYVPIPVISSQIDSFNQNNKPLDLSKPKTIIASNSPLDLSIKKGKKMIQEKLYPCEYCSIHFRSLKTLQAHQENYCMEYRKQMEKDSDPITDTIDKNRSQSLSAISKSSLKHSSLFICRLCKYRGNTRREMQIHFKYHLSTNKSRSTDNIPIKSPIPTNEFLLKCTICSAMFDYEQTLLNHIKCVHTNETLLKCLSCQSRFCSKWNLIRHMKLSHTNMKYDEEEEEEEEEESSDSKNLIRQIVIKKKFSCLFCHIKFTNIDTLNQHMINYCSSRPTTDDLSNNIKIKDNNDTYCSSCEISFQHKTSYDAHKMFYCRSMKISSERFKEQ